MTGLIQMSRQLLGQPAQQSESQHPQFVYQKTFFFQYEQSLYHCALLNLNLMNGYKYHLAYRRLELEMRNLYDSFQFSLELNSFFLVSRNDFFSFELINHFPLIRLMT